MKKIKKKMHVKVGDTVKIVVGKDKGKTGLIEKILKERSQLIVKGINIKKKHLKPSQPGETGETKQIEFPIHSSNVCKYED